MNDLETNLHKSSPVVNISSKMPSSFTDRTGLVYGRLTAIKFVGFRNGRSQWLCHCECGNEKEVDGKSLGSGHTKSCGCLVIERISKLNLSHGHSRVENISPEYTAWINMRARCLNPNQTGYKNYGGRGIKVCDRWLNSFENFLEDMGNKPDGLTLERKDFNRNYEPDNCVWANCVIQANNTSRNRVVVFDGKSLTLAQWATAIGISASIFWDRLSFGWSVERALSTPPRKMKPFKDWNHAD